MEKLSTLNIHIHVMTLLWPFSTAYRTIEYAMTYVKYKKAHNMTSFGLRIHVKVENDSEFKTTMYGHPVSINVFKHSWEII